MKIEEETPGIEGDSGTHYVGCGGEVTRGTRSGHWWLPVSQDFLLIMTSSKCWNKVSATWDLEKKQDKILLMILIIGTFIQVHLEKLFSIEFTTGKSIRLFENNPIEWMTSKKVNEKIWIFQSMDEEGERDGSSGEWKRLNFSPGLGSSSSFLELHLNLLPWKLEFLRMNVDFLLTPLFFNFIKVITRNSVILSKFNMPKMFKIVAAH